MTFWHLWAVLGICLFIAEIFTSGFYLASLGIASLVSALFAYFGFTLFSQGTVFLISVVITFWGCRHFLAIFDNKSTDMSSNTDALVGKEGRITERITADGTKGRVHVGGEDWRCVSLDKTEIKKGERVEISKIEGNTLYVKLLSSIGGSPS
jgi:membrane protein implicated in regulation of membrane protease activity